MRVIVAGATGLVGSEMLKVLEERWPAGTMDLIPVASERSAGREVFFSGKHFRVVTMEDALGLGAEAALFSAGSAFSLEWGPRLAEKRVRVIDNSSAWRMDPGVPLVVPEINPMDLKKDHFLIANPNCSTIQMLMALKPLHDAWGLEEVVVSTYQAVTGTGRKALQQLEDERMARSCASPAYPYPIDLNLIPQVDVFLDNGYTKEELKMRQESQKILHLPVLRVSATCVRVPITGGHSESIAATFRQDVSVEEARLLLGRMPGVSLLDEPEKRVYPMPLYCRGKNEVFVGRLRRDPDHSRRLHLWVVADNLRKGAATNAVQILEFIRAQGWI